MSGVNLNRRRCPVCYELYLHCTRTCTYCRRIIRIQEKRFSIRKLFPSLKKIKPKVKK